MPSPVLIIGILITAGIIFCGVKDSCEYKDPIGSKQTHSFEAHDDENGQLNSSVPIIDKLFRCIPILLILPCAIAIIAISFVIFKAIHKLIREKLE